MIRNYLKVAFRNLTKHKGYSLINVMGLAIGIACFILILLYVQDELSYDQYHSQADRIYRVAEILEGAEESASVPFPTGETLVAEYPDFVETSVRFFNLQAPSVAFAYEASSGEIRRFNERRFFFTDSTLFEVFDFELLRGNPQTVLKEPNTILVTESTAERYFGAEDPIGKTLRMETQGTNELEVVGVLKDVPVNSHFQFDLLASFATLNAQSPNGNFQNQNWYWNPTWTYLLLAEQVQQADVEANFPGFVERFFPPQIQEQAKMYLQPLTDIHLHSRLDFEIRPNSDVAYVYIFSAIAVFVLLIACINFMNLSTARSAQRAREVGMRKALGAVRLQLVRQFLGESMLTALLAGFLAIPLIYATLPVLNTFAGKALTFSLGENLILWGSLIGVPLVVGALSGLYPAFFLSAFQPARVLKGTLNSGRANAATWLRKGLVTVQFVISIVLIVGTIVAYQQLDYMQNKQLGFEKEQVVLVPIQLTPFWRRYNTFKQEAEQYPNIQHVTIIEDVPGSKYQTENYQPEGLTEPQQYPRLTVHDAFVETFSMELAAGRGYAEAFRADSAEAIMINEALVQQLGWGAAEDALGKRITLRGQAREVIGVFKDFHYASLHQDIGPFVVERYPVPGSVAFFGRYLAVRINANDIEGTLAFLAEQWERYVPNRPFEYLFLDDELDALYKAEATLGQVATVFSILAIFVACLGLFGMASFAAEQRTKEIGVRKVLGASVAGIILMLSKESAKLVGIAFLVACPLAYFAIDAWLLTFPYRIAFSIWWLVIAGAMVFLLSWLTVSMQSVRAATVNPVDSLKYE